MDANMTFRIEPEIKAEMITLCDQLGMTPSAAFNIFAKAFVREKGMPFSVKIQKQDEILPDSKILSDGREILHEYLSAYKKLAD